MKNYRRYFLGLFLILLAGLGFVFRYDIHDWIKLRGYTPSSSIVAIADDTTMLSGTRRIFFVNRPLIADRDTFNHHCRENEHSIVLGCYIAGQQGIYILNVTDDRLEGIEEVTAAHEVLHAVYERLGKSDRERVNQLLEDTFSNIKDPRVIETIELYRKQDPSVVLNEMHSIFGTEVRNLPAELEQYYSQYFADRLKIVRLAEQYEQAFTERRNKIRQYDAELSVLKSEIEIASLQLDQKSSELTQLRLQMDAHRSNGRTDAYNALVPTYNSKVNSYNTQIDEVTSKINRYNATVQQRNEIVSEEAELIKAIDSREVIPDSRH